MGIWNEECAACCDRKETLTEMLLNNEKQINAMIKNAMEIKAKIEGTALRNCGDGEKQEGYPGIPGLYKQVLDNTNLLAELYEIILTIDSRL